MTFKQRFLASLPHTPPELKLQLDAFVVFERCAVAELDDHAVDVLTGDGLPCRAPPFLSFSGYSASVIADLRKNRVIPEAFVPLGQNGAGNVLGVDAATSEVIYLDHDASNVRVFINSTLPLFLESLCIYQEHLRAGTVPLSLDAIGRMDPPAVHPTSMWYVEAHAG
jgi:hypothetical protein